ncbi:hypothetical protein [Kitasatospora sp. NPDC058190]|uniref:hypothetical protein n=1 Tax=Kitasatospora sp. NPDC058190 TaxID=3346371 RepID=UPI0036DDD1BE
MRRSMWWAAAAVCGLVAVSLIIVAVLVNLDTANRVASIVGAIVAITGLTLTLRSLRHSPAGSSTPDSTTSARDVTVKAEHGAEAAGNDIYRGPPRPRHTQTTPPPQTDKRRVTARGPGSKAAGRDIIDSRGDPP